MTSLPKNLNNLSSAPELISTNDGSVALIGNTYCAPFALDELSHKILLKNSNQIYLKDLSNLTQNTILVSTTDGVTPANASIESAVFVGDDASRVALSTNASNFTPQNGVSQIYLKDLTNLSSAPVLLSTTDGVTPANSTSRYPHRVFGRNSVIFTSDATNLGAATGGTNQVYIKGIDNIVSNPFLVSSSDNGITPGNFPTIINPINSAANYPGKPNLIFFQSASTNFNSPNSGASNVYAKDLNNPSQAPFAVNITLDGKNIGEINTPFVEPFPDGENYLIHAGSNSSTIYVVPAE